MDIILAIFFKPMREGGFRPMVFMGHPLAAAFFVMTTAVAAAALWRTQTRVLRLPPAGVTAYLSAILVLCKIAGSFDLRCRYWCLWSVSQSRARNFVLRLVLVTIALLYPTLRVADLVPTGSMIEAANSISTDRAESLKTRFDNEDQLLQRASQRFSFRLGTMGTEPHLRQKILEKMSALRMAVG